MARLFTTGFEVGSPASFTLAGEDAGFAASVGAAQMSISTAIVRSGTNALKIAHTAQQNLAIWKSAALSNVPTYYTRCACYFSTMRTI